MPNPFFRAYCKSCGTTVGTREDNSTFLDPFFLPERCPGCHDHHCKSSRSHYYDDCLYRVEYGFWKFVPHDQQPTRRWWNPFSWPVRGDNIWVEWDEWKKDQAA